MGLSDGKLGDVLADAMIKHFLYHKYGLSDVSFHIDGNRIVIRSYRGLNELHRDHCMHVKAQYMDGEYCDVLEFRYEYFLDKMLNWYKER